MELKEILERKFVANISILNILTTARKTKYTVREMQKFDKDLGDLMDYYVKKHEILKGEKLQKEMVKVLKIADGESHELFVLITAQLDNYLNSLKHFVKLTSKEIRKVYKKKEKLSKEEYSEFERFVKRFKDLVNSTMKELDSEIRAEYQKLLDIATGTKEIKGNTFMERMVEVAKIEKVGFGAYWLVRQEERGLLKSFEKEGEDLKFIIKELHRLDEKKQRNKFKEILGQIEKKIEELFKYAKQGMKGAYLIIMRDCLFKFLMLEDAKKLYKLDVKFAAERLIPKKFADDLSKQINEMFKRMFKIVEEELDELRRELTTETGVRRSV